MNVDYSFLNPSLIANPQGIALTGLPVQQENPMLATLRQLAGLQQGGVSGVAQAQPAAPQPAIATPFGMPAPMPLSLTDGALDAVPPVGLSYSGASPFGPAQSGIPNPTLFMGEQGGQENKGNKGGKKNAWYNRKGIGGGTVGQNILMGLLAGLAAATGEPERVIGNYAQGQAQGQNIVSGRQQMNLAQQQMDLAERNQNIRETESAAQLERLGVDTETARQSLVEQKNTQPTREELLNFERDAAQLSVELARGTFANKLQESEAGAKIAINQAKASDYLDETAQQQLLQVINDVNLGKIKIEDAKIQNELARIELKIRSNPKVVTNMIEMAATQFTDPEKAAQAKEIARLENQNRLAVLKAQQSFESEENSKNRAFQSSQQDKQNESILKRMEIENAAQLTAKLTSSYQTRGVDATKLQSYLKIIDTQLMGANGVKMYARLGDRRPLESFFRKDLNPEQKALLVAARDATKASLEAALANGGRLPGTTNDALGSLFGEGAIPGVPLATTPAETNAPKPDVVQSAIADIPNAIAKERGRAWYGVGGHAADLKKRFNLSHAELKQIFDEYKANGGLVYRVDTDPDAINKANNNIEKKRSATPTDTVGYSVSGSGNPNRYITHSEGQTADTVMPAEKKGMIKRYGNYMSWEQMKNSRLFTDEEKKDGPYMQLAYKLYKSSGRGKSNTAKASPEAILKLGNYIWNRTVKKTVGGIIERDAQIREAMETLSKEEPEIANMKYNDFLRLYTSLRNRIASDNRRIIPIK